MNLRRFSAAAAVCALWVGAAAGTAAGNKQVTAAPTPLAVVTIAEGDAALLRGPARLALAEGVRVGADDIIELAPQARLLRLEFNDGSSIDLGPATRLQLAPRLAAERGKAAPRAYVLNGWLKLSTTAAAPLALATPGFDLAGITRVAVVAVQAERSWVFAEAGELTVRPLPGAAAGIAVRGGELLTLAPAANGSAKTETAPSRPSPDFLQALPRAFLDSLPARAAMFQGKDVPPKRVADLGYADLRAWLNAEPALRKANLARWRPLANDADFTRELLREMKLHPEWEPVLFPEKPASGRAAAVAKTPYTAPRN